MKPSPHAFRRLFVFLSLLFPCLLVAADDVASPGGEGPLVISEFLAVSDERFLDEEGEARDWVEIFNRSGETVSLEGWHLSDDLEEEEKWAFPGIDLPGGGYLVVYASGENREETGRALHASFKLSGEGEALVLKGPGGRFVFGPSYPSQRAGYSYGMTAEGTYRYFPQPSPGEANGNGGRCFVEPVTFSVERGYFDEGFTLALSCETPEAVIRYTTDGNEPDVGTLFGGAKGEVYGGPVRVEGTTVVRAYATRPGWEPSEVVTHTYLFLADVPGQSPNGEVPAGWPEGVVNGQRFDFGMDPDVVEDPEYAEEILPALRALPSLSLVMDHEDLTGRKNGIYVNAREDGRLWERPGSVELLDPEGNPGFQIDAGVRIRGGFSRDNNNPKHSFRLFFRDEYGADALRFPLFGEEGVDRFDKFDLRTAQNYAWSLGSSNDARRNTFLREIFARDSQRALGQPYTRSRYYHLYLNGQYWGLYMSQERAEADYAESYFGGDADDYDVIKVEAGPYTVYATAGSMDAYRELHGLVSGDLSDADFYALQGKNPQGEDDPSLTRHVDVENLIDYMMIIFYVGSFDAPLAGSDRANNFYAIRNRERGDGWRFFAHDTEHSMMNVNENRMGPYPAGTQVQHFNPQYLHQQLMQTDAYRLAFADRAWKAFTGDGVFTPGEARERWLARQGEIALAIIGESARWGDQHERLPYTKEHWLRETDWIVNTFLEQRTEVVWKQLEGKGLTGDVLRPEFRPEGGELAEGERFKLTVGTLFRVQPGEIYYTLDGSDPREPDGGVSASAILYDREGPGVILESSARVRTRLVHEGRWSPIHETTYVRGGVLATASTLRLSELMYHPADPGPQDGFADGEAYEFLELWNPTGTAVDLTGARFEAGIDFNFPALQLGPGERGVLVHTREAFVERYGVEPRILGVYGEGEEGSRLDNGGERLRLVNLEGEVIFDFRYGDGGEWPGEADGGGYSLVMEGDGDPAEGGSWRSGGRLGGTPGMGESGDPGLSGYAEWKRGHGRENAGDDEDEDGDGRGLFLEYATGGNPLAADGGAVVAVGLEGAEAGALVVEVRRRDAEDVGVEIEGSVDLETWEVVTGELLEVESLEGEVELERWRVEQDGESRYYRARYRLEGEVR